MSTTTPPPAAAGPSQRTGLRAPPAVSVAVSPPSSSSRASSSSAAATPEVSGVLSPRAAPRGGGRPAGSGSVTHAQQLGILLCTSLLIVVVPFLFDAGVVARGSGIARNLVRFSVGGGGGGSADAYDDPYAVDDRFDALAAEIDGEFGTEFNATEFAASSVAEEAAAAGTAELAPVASDFTSEDQEGGPLAGAEAWEDTATIGGSGGGGGTGGGEDSRVAGETESDNIFEELGLSDIVGLGRSGGGGDEYDEGEEGAGDVASLEDGGAGGSAGGGREEAEEAQAGGGSAGGGLDEAEEELAGEAGSAAVAPVAGGSAQPAEGAAAGVGSADGEGADPSGGAGAGAAKRPTKRGGKGSGGKGGGVTPLPDAFSAGSMDLSDLDGDSPAGRRGKGGEEEGEEESPGLVGAAGAAAGVGAEIGAEAEARAGKSLLEFLSAEQLSAPLRTRKVSGYEWPATNLTHMLGFEDLPPPGMDAQIWRDFRPWRTRGFSMRDIIHTRARKTVLLHDKTEFSHEIFTTVIKAGVPYYLASEMKTLAHYKVARLLKLLDFILQLHSVGKRYPLPDMYFVWTVLPNPLLRARSLRDLLHAPAGVAPVFSLCKTDHDLDILYPNMYFRTLGWWTKVTRGLNQAALSMPFHKRKPRMWWRGSSGITWPAARPRVLSVSRWFMKSWADFAFTNMWTSVWRRWRRNQWRVHVPRNAMAIPFGGEKRTPIHAVARFRYTLHLPGSFSGTYSRALQFLLWTGTTIFFYDCPYYEFYYHHLEPWKHYIPVNHENLGQRMEWVVNHPKSVERVAAASRIMARTFLTADFLAMYWKQLLDEYARLQRFTVVLPDDACTCWRGDQKKPPPYLPRKTMRCPFLCEVIASA